MTIRRSLAFLVITHGFPTLAQVNAGMKENCIRKSSKRSNKQSRLSRHFRNTMKKHIILTCCIILAGCSTPRIQKDQKEHLKQLSISATTLNRYAGDEFKLSRDTVINLNKAHQSFNPAWPIEGGLDQALDIDDVRTRQAAVKSLENYAVLLYALSTDQEDDTVIATAQKFTSSIRRLETKVNIPSMSYDIIDKAVRGIARFFTEKQKYEAVKTVVHESLPHIDSICDLISYDFNGDSGIAAQIIVTASDTLVSADTFLRTTNQVNRRDALEAYDQANLAISRVGVVQHRISNLAMELKAMNRALNDSFENNDLRVHVRDLLTFKTGVERLIEDAKYYTR